MSHPSEGVVWFAGRMLRKFLENSHKRGWDQVEYDYAWRRLVQELEELEPHIEAVTDGSMPEPAQLEEMIDECADAANFLLMIAWKAAKWKGQAKDLPPPKVFRTGAS